jgi:hypothetical protein
MQIGVNWRKTVVPLRETCQEFEIFRQDIERLFLRAVLKLKYLQL